MKHYQNLLRTVFIPIALLLACAQAATAFAAELLVTRYFSGLWDQPQQENQGIMLQIVDAEPEGKTAVAYWFTYGDDLRSAWYIGIGHVEGPHVLLDMYEVSGIAFMEDDRPEIDNVQPIGTMALSFHNCNHGTASYDIGDGEAESGEFDIRRLAGLYNSRCSGGISDDTPSHARPVQLEVDLEPAREDVTGKGKARFWERVDRSDFHVSAEDIADGDYELQVCGTAEGVLTVVAGESAIRFRSPEAAGKELLSFDPRDCLIELHDGEGAVLGSGDAVLAPRTSDGQGPGGHGMAELSAELESTGMIEGVEGLAEFRDKMNSLEFEVEIRGVPQGSYPLDVDGIERGQIEVSAGDDRPKGRIRFSDPQKEDRLPLNFDPRGLLIEVRADTDVILELFFPEE